MEHLAVLPIRYPETRQSQFSLEHQDVVYLRPVIRGILPPSGVEILHASARCILHQHLVLPRFTGVRSPINMSPDLTGLGDVSGALEGRRLEYDKPIRVPAALPDSCEFRAGRGTLPLGASYLLADMTDRVLQRACHAWSSLIPPLRCAPFNYF